MGEHLAEKDRIVKVLVRHRFIEVAGTSEPLGFCAGPYCGGGFITPEEHAGHVADAIAPTTSTRRESND